MSDSVKKILIGIAIAVGGMMFLGMTCIMIGVGSVAKELAPTSVGAAPASVSISANQLWADYKANEVAADDRYKDKILTVSGIVKEIGKDITDQMYVTMQVGDQFDINTVQCMLATDQKTFVAQLQKGQQVRVKGECKGATVGNILLRGCVFQ